LTNGARVEIFCIQRIIFRMKTKLTCAALIFAMAGALAAAPLTFSEVSLLVRMRESDASVIESLSARRLMRALTSEQETKLKSEGASEVLLRALRTAEMILPTAEATAFETWQAEQQKAVESAIAAADIERANREAAQAAALAAWNREQEEKAARARADAEAAARYAIIPYSTDEGYYGYGAYPGMGFSSSCPTGIISSRPRTHHRSGNSISAGGLHWQNGSATVHTAPGISYYPMGTNGSTTNGASQIDFGRGGRGGGIRLGR
jgi:hypothetical protein